MSWYDIRNQADKAEVWIYDIIGEDIWGEGIVAKEFVRQLAALDVSQIDLHVNSPGGSVWDGQAIYNAIKRHPANVTTYVDGLAASIASVVALSGDSVIVAANSLMMIHKAWAMAIGSADDMRASADVLDKVDETISGIYQRKTARDIVEILAAMAEESWYTADEAVAFGLADEVGAGLKAVALAIDRGVMERYKNMPEELVARMLRSEITSVGTSGQTAAFVIPAPISTGAVENTGGGALPGEREARSKVVDFELDRIKLRR